MKQEVRFEDICQPVYEAEELASEEEVVDPQPRLVMTPWMLLDGLKACQEEAAAILGEVRRSGVGLERRYGVPYNPLAERLEELHFGINNLLRLLWRGGLWTEGEVVEHTAADGKAYQVVREPFTDGKPGGRPLPPDAPSWQRELLGLPTLSAAIGEDTSPPLTPDKVFPGVAAAVDARVGILSDTEDLYQAA